jgi:hypothetical protein
MHRKMGNQSMIETFLPEQVNGGETMDHRGGSSAE